MQGAARGASPRGSHRSREGTSKSLLMHFAAGRSPDRHWELKRLLCTGTDLNPLCVSFLPGFLYRAYSVLSKMS